uniref:HEPN domain-containing protein n=1 Tax=Aromatoleum buckelii TaxID=200254 RepID=A0ABX1N296_9RHOO
MKIDPSVLNALPHEQRDRFVLNANEIIIESFIFTGDRDYLTARFAFFQRQSHLFLWSAAQALEKYLKANILLLGSGSVRRIHQHTKLAKNLKETNPERLEIDTTIPGGWAEQGVADWPRIDVDGYLQRIETLGSPDVRYDQVQLELHLRDLLLLDRLAFRLRQRLIAEPVESCVSVR